MFSETLLEDCRISTAASFMMCSGSSIFSICFVLIYESLGLFRTATSWSPQKIGTFPKPTFLVPHSRGPAKEEGREGPRRPRQLGRRRGRREDHTDPRQEGGAAMAVPALDALYFLDARGNVIMSRTYREDIG